MTAVATRAARHEAILRYLEAAPGRKAVEVSETLGLDGFYYLSKMVALGLVVRERGFFGDVRHYSTRTFSSAVPPDHGDSEGRLVSVAGEPGREEDRIPSSDAQALGG